MLRKLVVRSRRQPRKLVARAHGHARARRGRPAASNVRSGPSPALFRGVEDVFSQLSSGLVPRVTNVERSISGLASHGLWAEVLALYDGLRVCTVGTGVQLPVSVHAAAAVGCYRLEGSTGRVLEVCASELGSVVDVREDGGGLEWRGGVSDWSEVPWGRWESVLLEIATRSGGAAWNALDLIVAGGGGVSREAAATIAAALSGPGERELRKRAMELVARLGPSRGSERSMLDVEMCKDVGEGVQLYWELRASGKSPTVGACSSLCRFLARSVRSGDAAALEALLKVGRDADRNEVLLPSSIRREAVEVLGMVRAEREEEVVRAGLEIAKWGHVAGNWAEIVREDKELAAAVLNLSARAKSDEAHEAVAQIWKAGVRVPVTEAIAQALHRAGLGTELVNLEEFPSDGVALQAASVALERGLPISLTKAKSAVSAAAFLEVCAASDTSVSDLFRLTRDASSKLQAPQLYATLSLALIDRNHPEEALRALDRIFPLLQAEPDTSPSFPAAPLHMLRESGRTILSGTNVAIAAEETFATWLLHVSKLPDAPSFAIHRFAVSNPKAANHVLNRLASRFTTTSPELALAILAIKDVLFEGPTPSKHILSESSSIFSGDSSSSSSPKKHIFSEGSSSSEHNSFVHLLPSLLARASTPHHSVPSPFQSPVLHLVRDPTPSEALQAARISLAHPRAIVDLLQRIPTPPHPSKRRTPPHPARASDPTLTDLDVPPPPTSSEQPVRAFLRADTPFAPPKSYEDCVQTAVYPHLYNNNPSSSLHPEFPPKRPFPKTNTSSSSSSSPTLFSFPSPLPPPLRQHDQWRNLLRRVSSALETPIQADIVSEEGETTKKVIFSGGGPGREEETTKKYSEEETTKKYSEEETTKKYSSWDALDAWEEFGARWRGQWTVEVLEGLVALEDVGYLSAAVMEIVRLQLPFPPQALSVVLRACASSVGPHLGPAPRAERGLGRWGRVARFLQLDVASDPRVVLRAGSSPLASLSLALTAMAELQGRGLALSSPEDCVLAMRVASLGARLDLALWAFDMARAAQFPVDRPTAMLVADLALAAGEGNVSRAIRTTLSSRRPNHAPSLSPLTSLYHPPTAKPQSPLANILPTSSSSSTTTQKPTQEQQDSDSEDSDDSMLQAPPLRAQLLFPGQTQPHMHQLAALVARLAPPPTPSHTPSTTTTKNTTPPQKLSSPASLPDIAPQWIRNAQSQISRNESPPTPDSDHPLKPVGSVKR